MKRTTKIALGLFGTWAVSDLEELWTMSRSSRRVLPRLPQALPIPAALRRDGVSQRHVTAGIATMGVVIALAAASGVSTEGRSPLFRGVLLGFGLHGFGHLGMTAAARGYVSGAVTAPTMVLPYWLWARRELAREGIREIDAPAVAVAAAGIPLAMGVHALMFKLFRD
ncbi:HXXEE domain-containing protein [Nucisporomicrobium flavum]|uniref:HXXEE domain-containing protein n=1 Tax=Nucisporomicrobium flavum TaxID=2785915 RepID=UPI003C2D1162